LTQYFALPKTLLKFKYFKFTEFKGSHSLNFITFMALVASKIQITEA
jgi:hypothetical protein